MAARSSLIFWSRAQASCTSSKRCCLADNLRGPQVVDFARIMSKASEHGVCVFAQRWRRQVTFRPLTVQPDGRADQRNPDELTHHLPMLRLDVGERLRDRVDRP